MVKIGFVKVNLPSTYLKAQLDHALGTETSKPGGDTLRGHIQFQKCFQAPHNALCDSVGTTHYVAPRLIHLLGSLRTKQKLRYSRIEKKSIRQTKKCG